MKSLNRTKTTPLPVQRTTRKHDLRILTSLPAGKMVPLAAVPLLREDSVTRCELNMAFEMAETVEILINAVHVNVKAYLVPKLALDRFNGMDDLNKSYEGLPWKEGDPVVPYFETTTAPAHGANQILTYMGKHFRPGTQINTEYVEAYNQIWNFRARNRSPDIAPRERLASTLAPAFWQHTAFAHIVPDFDQAIIDGEVALNIVESKLPVSGIGLASRHATAASNVVTVDSSNTAGSTTYPQAYYARSVQETQATGDANVVIRTVNKHPEVFAELAENGITVSLSNIEAARRTQAFAKLRQQYSGHTDEYIIDLLMDGITIPDQAYKQPILVGERSTIFGMQKRYASDGGNLTDSVVSGASFVNMSVSLPRIPTGGVLMFVAEITPEQFFERQKDVYLHTTAVDTLPQFLRDTLDPEKVSVVKNEYIDLDHDTPNGTFGYAPLNHEWNHAPPQIGGKFYRPEVDASFDEDRQRIWAVETQNPVLSQDFYLCTTMHNKPFVVTNQDPFEVVARGGALIRGNTVFGGRLIEANDDYEKIEAQVPQDRIAKP